MGLSAYTDFTRAKLRICKNRRSFINYNLTEGILKFQKKTLDSLATSWSVNIHLFIRAIYTDECLLTITSHGEYLIFNAKHGIPRYVMVSKHSSMYTVERERLEHLWDHKNLFEKQVVRATEG